ncbi:MAG: glycine cleavage system aminomethyltransferase GcvT [Candidatus Methanodesulfokora sp.]
MPLRTPLYGEHVSLGATFMIFNGWEMPLKYTSSIDETLSVRNSVGIFDVSHMGRLFISGKDSLRFLQLICTNDVDVEIGRGRYTLILNGKAGIMDDDTVFRLSEDRFFMVVNAGSRDKILSWLNKVKIEKGFNVEIKDETINTVMVAVQGPRSKELTEELIGKLDIKRYRIAELLFQDTPVLVSRSGYTGEDGYELIFRDVKKGITFFREILKGGAKPCGLGSRDILRLEAGMCLYGQDMDESITPKEAALESVVSYEKEFIGKESLLNRVPDKIRVGIKSKSKRSPRHGAKVIKNGEPVGYVTSGTYSPTINSGIGMAYVRPDLSSIGTTLQVDVKGDLIEVVVSEMPFYDTSKYGWRRVKS